MSTDLWSEASYDYDAERRARNLEMAKAASQGTWAFLALAQSHEEFGDRVALASDQIMATAAQHDVDMRELTDLFTERFALLMEAKENPFNDDSDDDTNDSDDDGDDDSDDNGADDEDSDDDSDDSDSGDDSDDSSDSDDGDDGDDDSDGSDGSSPPWGNKYSSLASAIRSGADPLGWSGSPFAGSSARKEAADGASAGPDQDLNDPAQADPGMSGGMGSGVPGMDGGIAETTKPRQMPAGGGMDPSMAPGDQMDGIGAPPAEEGFDPAANGGDIQQNESSIPPVQSARVDKISALMREIKRYNPTLSNAQCRKVAGRVYDQYLSKHAEDMNPLLFGDRAGVPDGPLTDAVKNWSPADMASGGGGGKKGPGGGGGGLPGMPKAPIPGGGGGAGAGAAGGEAAVAGGAGEAAAAGEIAGAARLLPLLAL